MPYIQCTFTLDLKDDSASTHGPVSVLPTIRPHKVYPLYIQTSFDGWFCTHSRDRTRSENNTATCSISIAPSCTAMNLTRRFRWEAIVVLCSLILLWRPRSELCANGRMNRFISVKPFLCWKLGHFCGSEIWQCWNSRTWLTQWINFEILSKSKEESPVIPTRLQCEMMNRRRSKR